MPRHSAWLAVILIGSLLVTIALSSITLSPWLVLWTMAAILLFALGFVAGQLQNQHLRNAITKLLNTATDHYAQQISLVLNVIQNNALAAQLEQQEQSQTLNRIERKIESLAQGDAGGVSSDRMRAYLDKLAQRQMIPKSDYLGLIVLFCEAIAVGEEELVQDGKCLVCGSTNPTLLEHPLAVREAHDPACPVPSRYRLAQEVMMLMPTEEITTSP